ncbi:MAG: protein-glutamate O-methyltransferase CheR [bacterium]
MLQPIPSVTPSRLSTGPLLDDLTFYALREFIYERTGIFFPDKKKYLIEGRLGKRLQILKLESFEDYIQLLKYGRKKDEEFDYLCEAITINETFFFRNEPQFDAIEQTVIPELVRAKQAQLSPKIRIWSAGCSSGEEPYTLAMIFLECLKPKYPSLSLEIVGTDINGSVLQIARRAIYSEYSIRNMPQAFLEKYFSVENGRYVLRPDLKQMVSFRYLNLYDRTQMKTMRNFDIILCRNVLIYFDLKSKIQVVSDLYGSLNYGGALFIGYSELLHGISTAFKVKSLVKTTAYKKE